MQFRSRLAGWGIMGVLLVIVPSPCAFSEGVASDSDTARDERMTWWREARFGMFIHWGLYSVAAGEFNGKPVKGLCSWTLWESKAPLALYMPLIHQFNPMKFDADAWVRLAKQAGMKYIVITSKHHEGFALFDSQVSDFDVMATPFKRDIMKELAEACRREGLQICWYHSILDWRHPDYIPRRPGDERPTDGVDFDRYVVYMKEQLRELLTNYGPIGVLWFDGEWDDSWTHERGVDLYDYVRRLQPDIIINNRVDKGRQGMAGQTRDGGFMGDFGTPEQEIPATGLPGVDWETCMTMNDTWGFKKNDTNWKSDETLLRMLVDCASKGGNFLLNVGPMPDGVIPEASVKRLETIGKWMAVNNDSIYGTSASPFRRLEWGRCTQKTDEKGQTKLYLHVFDRPADGELLIPGLKNDIQEVYLLVDQNRRGLPFNRLDEGIVVHIPQQMPDPLDTVIALHIKGRLEIEPFRIHPQNDGSYVLHGRDADLHGTTIRYDAQHGHESIGYWTESTDWVSWPLEVNGPGTYEVEVCYGCEAGHGGGTYRLEIGGQKLVAEARVTGGWFNRIAESIGTIAVDRAGIQPLEIRLVSKPGLAVFDLKQVRLIPRKE